MRRREVVALLGSAAVFAPGVEGKAQPRRKIAYLAPARTQHLIDASRKGCVIWGTSKVGTSRRTIIS